MTPALTQTLVEEFQSLYTSETTFICCDGWYNLIHEMSKELVEKGYENHITCVKQKFGQLRVVFDAIVERDLRAVVVKYECMSKNTCEICGSTEDVRMTNVDNWIGLRCAECLLEIQLERL